MTTYSKTTQVCQLLDVPYHRLVNMIRYMLISPPAKDYSGDYLWSECDVAAARAVLAKRANPPTTTRVDVNAKKELQPARVI